MSCKHVSCCIAINETRSSLRRNKACLKCSISLKRSTSRKSTTESTIKASSITNYIVSSATVIWISFKIFTKGLTNSGSETTLIASSLPRNKIMIETIFTLVSCMTRYETNLTNNSLVTTKITTRSSNNSYVKATIILSFLCIICTLVSCIMSLRVFPLLISSLIS